jgi:hypothetical protein
LIVHALLLPDDSFVILVIEMALGAPDHNRDLAKFDLLGLVLLDEVSGDVALSLPLLDVNVYL